MSDTETLPHLRVATLNLLAHPYALRERVEHLAALLADERVDILMLQEVLRRKTGKVNIPAVLGEKLGLIHSAEHHYPGRSSGNVTLSRTPLEKLTSPSPHSRMLATATIAGGRRIVTINNHGAWGSFAGGDRLAEALAADDLARATFAALSPSTHRHSRPPREERPIVIYGGDLNTVPDAAPIRYLRGLDVVRGASTHWLDAWDAAEAGVDGATIFPSVYSEIEAGERADTPYLPERHPRQRYDYLLVHEWSHGHAGDPLRARRFATETFPHGDRDLTVSDHYGVLADLYLPA